MQANGSEQGYNTSGGTPFDDKAGPWTHDIKFYNIQATAISLNGQDYFVIMVDLNEPNGAKSTISLTNLQFYTSAQGSKTTTDLSQLGTLLVTASIPPVAITPFSSTRVATMAADQGTRSSTSRPARSPAPMPTTSSTCMSTFGDADMTTAGGFEEFVLVRNLAPVPEMSALFPIVGLLVAVGSTHILRRRRMAKVSS